MNNIEQKFCELRFTESDTKTGEFSGYGAIFGNKDAYGDVIEKGAFSDSLQEWKEVGKFPPMLLQHGGGFMGSADDLVPIGKWEQMSENSKGLKVEGRLFGLKTERGQYIYEGLKEGVLDGLSIGFRTKQYRVGTKPGEPNRILTDVDLLEVSIVTFPANPKARISNVKRNPLGSMTLEQYRDLEMGLRDAGLSRSHASLAIAHFKKKLNQCDAGILENPVLREVELPETEDEQNLEILKEADGLLSKILTSCLNKNFN